MSNIDKAWCDSIQVMIDEAKLINGDNRKFIKQNNFSTTLNGRFYKNSSLQSHKCRLLKMAQIKEKRKELHNANQIQEQQIRKIEKNIEMIHLVQRETFQYYIKFLKAVTTLQNMERKKNAIQQLRVLKAEYASRIKVSIFFHRYFFGSKGRQIAQRLRRKKSATIRIQTFVRYIKAKQVLKSKLHNHCKNVKNISCKKIQTMVRTYIQSQLYFNMKCVYSATKILKVVIQKFMKRKGIQFLSLHVVPEINSTQEQNKEEKYAKLKTLRLNEEPRKPFVVKAVKDMIGLTSNVECPLYHEQGNKTLQCTYRCNVSNEKQKKTSKISINIESTQTKKKQDFSTENNSKHTNQKNDIILHPSDKSIIHEGNLVGGTSFTESNKCEFNTVLGLSTCLEHLSFDEEFTENEDDLDTM